MARKIIKSYDCMYNGQKITINKYEFPPENTEGKWLMLIPCPRCGQESSELYPPLGTHAVTEKDDKLTFSPSLVCPFCGWHVWLKDGVITDC